MKNSRSQYRLAALRVRDLDAVAVAVFEVRVRGVDGCIETHCSHYRLVERGKLIASVSFGSQHISWMRLEKFSAPYKQHQTTRTMDFSGDRCNSMVHPCHACSPCLKRVAIFCLIAITA